MAVRESYRRQLLAEREAQQTERHPLIKATTFLWAGWIFAAITLGAGVLFAVEPFGTDPVAFLIGLATVTVACFATALFNQREAHK